MLYIGSYMGQVSAARFELGDVREGFVQPEMCWMFFETQAVEHEHIQVPKCVHRCRRNLTQVSCIGKIIEAIRHHGQPAMNHLERRNLQPLTHTKRCPGINCVREHLQQSTTKVRGFENVFEDTTDVRPCLLVSENAQGAEAKVQGTNVIKTKD